MVDADVQVWSHRLQSRREGFGIASTVHENKARGFSSQNIAKMPICGMLPGTESQLDTTNFVFGKWRR